MFSCQSVSDEHFDHPKVLTRSQEGLFDIKVLTSNLSL